MEQRPRPDGILIYPRNVYQDGFVSFVNKRTDKTCKPSGLSLLRLSSSKNNLILSNPKTLAPFGLQGFCQFCQCFQDLPFLRSGATIEEATGN